MVLSIKNVCVNIMCWCYILFTCNRKQSFRKAGVVLKRAVFLDFLVFSFFGFFFQSLLFSDLSSLLTSFFSLVLLFIFNGGSSPFGSSSASPSSSSRSVAVSTSPHWSTTLLLLLLLLLGLLPSASPPSMPHTNIPPLLPLPRRCRTRTNSSLLTGCCLF